MFSGILGDQLGGRESLRILALFYVISALGCAFAWNWPALLVFRFIGGLGIGGSSVLGPVYIAEIAPARWRGLLVGSFQINIVIGILVAYLSNYLIGLGNFGLNEWRWQLGIAAAPAVLFLVMLFAIPRSARWLVTKNRIPEAREVLDLLGSPDGSERTRRHRRLDSRRRHGTLRAAVPAQVSPAHLSRVHGGRLQSARGHQRNPVLPELHLCDGRLQQGLRRSAGGSGGRHEPGRDPARDVADRQARPQDAAADWRLWHDVLPERRGCGLLHRAAPEPAGVVCWSPTSPSSRSRWARSSGCTSARSFPTACARRDRRWAVRLTGS